MAEGLAVMGLARVALDAVAGMSRGTSIGAGRVVAPSDGSSSDSP